jgi:hypothetical protein
MKKIFLNFIVLFFIINSVYAQDFYFGFSPGEISSVYSKVENKNFSTHMNVFQITGNFIFSVIFKNNVELQTGIMYYNYPYNIRMPIGNNGTVYGTLYRNPAYHAFSLPMHAGYKFKLANRLFANIYSGLNFDFYFAPYNVDYMPYSYDPDDPWNGWCISNNLVYWPENKLHKRFNIMFANTVSIQYFTKFNMGISLYASYYSGLFQVWESTFHYTYDLGKTFHKNLYLSRGSYWNFGIELGFKFAKNKEERRAASSARKEQRKKIMEVLEN